MIDKVVEVEARHSDCRFSKIESRLEKIEDRMLEITKWQYKAIGFLTAFTLVFQVAPVIVKIIIHKQL